MRALTVVAAGVVLALSGTVPSAQSAAADTSRDGRRVFVPARTPWGDPDLQGIYTNKDENGIPMERPAQFEGRTAADIRPSELQALIRQRNEAGEERAPGIGGAETGAGPVHWYEVLRREEQPAVAHHRSG